MILANLRQRLTSNDIDLAVRLLAGDDEDRRASIELTLQNQGPDGVLDAPDLLSRLQGHSQLGSPSSALFLYVAVRDALRSVGIDDGRLADYLGALLFEFGLRGRAFRAAEHSDQEYHYLADIVADVENSTGRVGFLLRAHLGNFSLWIAGVFPEYITARKHRKGGPDLGYYDEIGARGFRLASDHRLAHEFDLADIYAKAARSFSTIRIALNRMSDRLFFPRWSSPDRLMRQVADEFNLAQ